MFSVSWILNVWIDNYQAYEKCFQNLHYVERHEEHTIAHAVQTNYKKTKVIKFISGFIIWNLWTKLSKDNLSFPSIITSLILNFMHRQYVFPQVYLWPAPTRTGMKAGRIVQTILHLAGFKNVKSKVSWHPNQILVLKINLSFECCLISNALVGCWFQKPSQYGEGSI